MPIDSTATSPAASGDLFSLYTLLGGIAVVLLFAFHGAIFLTLRTTGELCRRAAAAAGRLSIAAAVVGAGFLVWTVVVAVDKNDKDVFPPVAPGRARDRRARARRVVFVRLAPQRLGVRADRGRRRSSSSPRSSRASIRA